MPWNYRIVKHINCHHGDDFYGIHEVHYDDKKVAESLTTESVGIIGDNFEDLMAVHERFRKAFQQPVLVFDETADKFTGEVQEEGQIGGEG